MILGTGRVKLRRPLNMIVIPGVREHLTVLNPDRLIIKGDTGTHVFAWSEVEYYEILEDMPR